MGSAEDGRRLHLEYRLDGGVAVVKVTGDLDVFTSGEFREDLLRIISDENERSLVVNLAGVSFIDSTGTGVLVGVWHRVRATNGMLAVAAPKEMMWAMTESNDDDLGMKRGVTNLMAAYREHGRGAVPAC